MLHQVYAVKNSSKQFIAQSEIVNSSNIKLLRLLLPVQAHLDPIEWRENQLGSLLLL